MSADGIQTIKAANDARVNTERAKTMYSDARGLGDPRMCPASAHHINFDIYGRPANQNTLPINHDSACASLTQYNTQKMLQIENQVRPYTPIASPGNRGVGGSDTMGKGRAIIPRNLYGYGNDGDFVRHYNTRNNTPWEQPHVEQARAYHMIRPRDFSTDATIKAFVH